MDNITAIHGSGAMTPEQVRALKRLDESICNALTMAKNERVPQGLLVAILHGHAHKETYAMIYTEGLA